MIKAHELTQTLATSFAEFPLSTVALMAVSFAMGGAFTILSLLVLEHVRKGLATPKTEE